jgi:hypothetical protein
VSGVVYNVYTASSGGALAGYGNGTGSALNITLNTTPSSTTTYYVEAALGSCLSTSRSSVSITVNPLPELTVSDMAVCYNSTAVLNASSSNATLFIWYRHADYTGEIIQSASFETSKLKSDTVFYVEALSAEGCISRDSVQITVNPLPELTVRDTTVCSDIMTVFSVSSQNAVSLTWHSDAIYTDTISYTSSYKTVLTVDTVFYVEALSDKKCSTKDAMHISVVRHSAVIAMDDRNKIIKISHSFFLFLDINLFRDTYFIHDGGTSRFYPVCDNFTNLARIFDGNKRHYSTHKMFENK